MSKNAENEMGEMSFRMPESRRLERGQVIKGTVVSVGSSHVFLDVGGKSEASLEVKELLDENGVVKVKEGDTLEAFVVETEPEIVLSHGLARAHLNVEALEDAHDLGLPVEGRVTKLNKGGLEVDLNGKRAFCPISQITLGFCEDASAFVGQTLQFRITEFAENGRNIVVSRRSLLAEEQREAEEVIRDRLHEGEVFEGEVVRIQPYGAFVDIGGGIQGMVHVSQIAQGHIENPEEALKVGQRVRVKVMKIEKDPKHPEKTRIALSMRALMGDPWEEAASRLREGETLTGRVVRLQPFGAFVEVAPGIDGLVHVSELSDSRVGHPSDVVTVGQEVTVLILKVDPVTKRLSLSMRGQSSSGGGEEIGIGSEVEAVVDKIKPFGLLVRIKGARSGRGLIPIEETGAERANLRKAFPEGAELKAVITEIEPGSGKMRLSIKALSEAVARSDYKAFLGGGTEPRPTAGPSVGTSGGGGGSFGSLGDLLKKSLAKKP
jgi:small subunit ribosomal protein S1